MAAAGKGGGGNPTGKLADKITQDFGGIDKFKAQFSDAAKAVEGSGWALLLYDPELDQLVLTQVEKQNFMHLPELPILLSLDVWEHAYYLAVLERPSQVRGGVVERSQLGRCGQALRQGEEVAPHLLLFSF